MNQVRLYLSFCLMAVLTTATAQLDTIHWLPPMHARAEWGPQYLYLSTPEVAPFEVNIRNSDGSIRAKVTISNAQPFRYILGDNPQSVTLVDELMLHKPVQMKGLIIDAPKKFYAYYRVHSSSEFHAGDLTCKGRAALGTEFRIGHLLQEVDGNNWRSNFVSVMATEDSTFVTFSDFNDNVDFRINGANVQSSGAESVFLRKGESVVFSQYIDVNAAAQPVNGFMGSLVESSRPVAVSCGSWVGAPVTLSAHDIGIDQIAPFEKTGKEYILCKGNGSSALEHPIIIAHRPDTKIWLNGQSAVVATLQPGEYYVVPTNAYTIDGNLYIQSSEDVFMYQMIGGTSQGTDQYRTAGLIFVPPISCAIPNAVDNIYEPNLIGNMRFEGGLMIAAMKDSTVIVRIDGNQVSIGSPAPVMGNPDFVTYRKLNLFSQTSNPKTISVVAEGAIQVAMYGRNEPASFAAFYSGFSKIAEPKIQVRLEGDGVCPDTLYASGHFDGVQWMYEDSILQYGPDTMFVAYAPGLYTALGYLGVCRRNDFAQDTVSAVFNSPEFPYAAEEPSCFGFDDGLIAFGSPYGGLPPYQFSVDNGKTFTKNSDFNTISAGDYKLVVKDSTGCYNRPLAISIGQPDSFLVEIIPRRMKLPIKPGDEVVLEAVPDRPVGLATWHPVDSTECPDCLRYSIRPIDDTWVTVAVFDEAGCPAIDSFFLAVEPNVFAPNALRHGSAFGNDRFMLYSRDPLPIPRLMIFDRWGELMYKAENLVTNAEEGGWDGTFRGRNVLPGVYVFFAEVEVVPGKTVIIKGDITVL